VDGNTGTDLRREERERPADDESDLVRELAIKDAEDAEAFMGAHARQQKGNSGR
jgi:DNA-binding GntR family transcriptional regulator